MLQGENKEVERRYKYYVRVTIKYHNLVYVFFVDSGARDRSVCLYANAL